MQEGSEFVVTGSGAKCTLGHRPSGGTGNPCQVWSIIIYPSFRTPEYHKRENL